MSRLVLRRVRACALLLSAPLLAQAQSPAPAASPAPTPRAGVATAEEVTVLTLDVLALDRKDRPVFGLVAADFEVKVAGKVQTLEFFEAPLPGGARSTREGRADSEERMAGTTTPFTPGGATVRHVLFYVDLEQLPSHAVLDAAAAIRKVLEHPATGRYGLATHLGAVSARVWDADSAEAIEQEADAIAADVLNHSPGLSGSARGRGIPASPENSPSDYEERQFVEKGLIDDYVNAACNGADTRREAQSISRYLAADARRVREGVRQLRETCERFAALEGPRHLIVLSEGYERVPGYNFLSRLQAQQQARCSRGGASFESPQRVPPGLPGAERSVGAGRFAFPIAQIVESDELARWLGASGITVHYVDPGSTGRNLPTAEDRGAWEPGLRSDEHRNLQDAPLRLVDATGGLSRLYAGDLVPALETFLDAASGTYRLGVRLLGVDSKKTYRVKVAVRKNGITALARSAYQPGTKSAQVLSAVATGARRSSLAAAVDEKRPGAARLAKKPLPLTLEWKGRSTLASKDPAKPFWKLTVSVPHEALAFRPEDDAMLASVQIVVEAVSLDGPLRDSTADDWFLSYTSPEYREARDTAAVRTVTLQLPPGRWELKVSVHDALADSYGTGVLRVDAPR
ncbi:MAG: hypothetical protein NEA02_15835 [Thermoanaerobaculia bacterium]|nr:hypothetical protein [Thermoanaerobaculia bacterium]